MTRDEVLVEKIVAYQRQALHLVPLPRYSVGKGHAPRKHDRLTEGRDALIIERVALYLPIALILKQRDVLLLRIEGVKAIGMPCCISSKNTIGYASHGTIAPNVTLHIIACHYG